MQPPPGPKGLPVLGHLLDLRRDILGFFTHCARRYGDVVGARVGPRPAVLLSDPADIEHVLVRHAAGFRKPRLFWGQVRAIFGNGLLTSEGAFWLRQRRLAAPAFAGQRLAGYGGEMVRHTQRMLDGWQPGVARDLHADMMALTLRIAAKTLFGVEVEEDMAAIDEAVTLLTHEIAVRFSRPFVIPDSLPLPGHIRYRRGLRAIERLVGRILAERRARLDRADDLLSTLMLARDERRADVRPAAPRRGVTLLLAGHETTALALSWTATCSGATPRSEDALAAEVRRGPGRPGRGRGGRAAAAPRRSGRHGSDAALPARLGDRPRGGGRLRVRRLRGPDRHDDY